MSKNSKNYILESNLDFNNPLFNFLKPQDNELLKKLPAKDLQHMLLLLNNYYLEYRQKLGFKKVNTFGIEIEFITKRFQLLNTTSYTTKINKISQIINDNSWQTHGDSSLHKYGIEISSPILKDTTTTWNRLEKICYHLNKIGYINELCGGHVHIGTQVIGDNLLAWDNFLKLWIIYEDIILRFLSGEYLILRPEIDKWACSISEQLYESYNRSIKFTNNVFTNDSLVRIFLYVDSRYHAINFQKVNPNKTIIKPNNTIEFRSPNGTLNPIIWQNNINLFLNLLTSVKKRTFNTELLNQRFTELSTQAIYHPDKYKEIDLTKALELCDLIFDNNLNKLYFLKQYLKNFKTENTKFKKAPILTKKLNSKH